MAFPTTGVLDTFNRANGAIGSNWTNDTIGQGATAYTILGNVMDSGSGLYAEMYWNPATYGPDCEVYATVATIGNGTGPSFGLMIRAQSPGSASCDGYRLTIEPAVSNRWTVSEVLNAGETTLATGTQAVSAGHKIGLEAIGNAIKAYYYNGSSWSNVVDTTDPNNTYSGAGNIGIWSYSGASAATDHQYDDFSGGTVVGGGTDYDADPNAAASTASGPTPGVTTLTRPYVLTTIS